MNIVSTNLSDFINESKLDSDLQILINIAKSFDDPYEFDSHLNRNKFGHNKEFAFLGERFKRLNRGTRLQGNETVTIYRTADQPIMWGDYVYLNEDDANHAFSVGQGNKVYHKVVKQSDIVETSVDSEYYYSPKSIAKLGNDLIDLWHYANKKSVDTEIVGDNLKSRTTLFYSELKKLRGKFDDFNDYEEHAFGLSLKFNVPFDNYEKYFK